MKNHGGRFGPLFLTLALLVSVLGGFSTANAAVYVNDGQSTISGALSSIYAGHSAIESVAQITYETGESGVLKRHLAIRDVPAAAKVNP